MCMYQTVYPWRGLTFSQAYVDAPVTLQTLHFLLHSPLAAAVEQSHLLQHFQGYLAIPTGQHGVPVLACQALPHDPEAMAALLVLVTLLSGS